MGCGRGWRKKREGGNAIMIYTFVTLKNCKNKRNLDEEKSPVLK